MQSYGMCECRCSSGGHDSPYSCATSEDVDWYEHWPNRSSLAVRSCMKRHFLFESFHSLSHPFLGQALRVPNLVLSNGPANSDSYAWRHRTRPVSPHVLEYRHGIDTNTDVDEQSPCFQGATALSQQGCLSCKVRSPDLTWLLNVWRPCQSKEQPDTSSESGSLMNW